MRILCTGAAGFVGSHLCDALTKHDVYGIDNFTTGRDENLTAGVTVQNGDVADRRVFYDLANFHQPELVIHCAASYSDPDKWHLDTRTNVEGGINAALVAKHHGARLIYFQTILPPVSSYAISKIASEQYQRLSGVPLTVFRLANIYGPRNLSGPVPVFYKRLTEGLPCTVVNTTRDMVYIADVVRAVVDEVYKGRTGTFDLCSGEQTTILDLYRHVASATGILQIPTMSPPNPDDVQGTISPDNRPPDWKPKMDLATGIGVTVASYREDGVEQTYTHLTIGKGADDE